MPIGKARVHREGRDLSIITYAAMVHTAQEAADILAKEGIEIEIIDLRTLCPLDRDAITQTVKKTNKVILLHEDTKTGGLAASLPPSSMKKLSTIRRAHRPHHRAGYAGAVLTAAGAFLSAQGGRRGKGSQKAAQILSFFLQSRTQQGPQSDGKIQSKIDNRIGC